MHVTVVKLVKLGTSKEDFCPSLFGRPGVEGRSIVIKWRKKVTRNCMYGFKNGNVLNFITRYLAASS